MIWEQRQLYPIDCLSDSICFNRKEVHYFSYWNYFSCLRGFVHFFSDSEFLLNLHWTNHMFGATITHFFWDPFSDEKVQFQLEKATWIQGFSAKHYIYCLEKQIKYPRTHLLSKEKVIYAFTKNRAIRIWNAINSDGAA